MTEKQPGEGVIYQFRVQLEALSIVDETLTRTNGAVFQLCDPQSKALELPTIVLPPECWDNLGRPGYLDVRVAAAGELAKDDARKAGSDV